MATPTPAELDDALFNLRHSIASNNAPILTTTPNPSAPSDTVTELSQATYLSFNEPTLHGARHKTFELNAPTRYAPNDKPIDLRSIYFAWLNKDQLLTDYVAAVQALNEELPSGAGGSVVNLGFAQKVELISWLSGEVDTSENIKPLESAGAGVSAGDAAAIAGGKGVPVQQRAATASGQKMMDARLLQIYDGERRMGDHNTALRGSKPIDFSAYRKVATAFLRSHASAQKKESIPQSLPTNLKKPSRRIEQPILLLSPSASSLLRMSNVKSFLESGVFIPPSALDASSNASSNLLQMTRLLPSIDARTPFRFILVDGTAMFKPSYWARVVGVFTTGQSWQFKSYKCPNPIELFSHYPGFYVGYGGEDEPENVKAWGRGITSVQVDKWTGSEKGRWRDRELVERIWARIEDHMRRAGWTKEGPGLQGQVR
ncbi:CDC73-domain-containing protein [Bimuria novae-zelandiae CBS 107.79]|uniref:CDC73-domain-containing protein n=1 Tax=Bimuria novae-zelandiae CBS 107.79 TaxID=1447943 RepID=A0A6A5VTI5_9PLEO|nr:CDC73-domain-containing protein [Bimuria novae-zelandiae CBS 107.79]